MPRLSLRYVKYQGKAYVEESVELDETGGTIGRDEHCDVLLPDPERSCSRLHGRFRYQAGSFYYENLSASVGTEHIPSGAWLMKGDEIVIDSEMSLGIGDYEILVQPLNEAVEASGPSDIWGEYDNGLRRIANNQPPDTEGDLWAFTPAQPAVEAIASKISQIDLSEPTISADLPIGTVPEPGPDFLDYFLAGVGMDDVDGIPEQQWPQVMLTAGKLLRVFVEETMRDLKVRDQSKAMLELNRTIIANNLLKVGEATVDADIVNERLSRLLSGGCPGLEDPVQNVRDGFADLLSHQLATEAGWQAVIQALLDRFDPKHFDKLAEEGIVFQKKAKCWDSFVQAYPRLVNEIQEFGLKEEFARGYEQAILQYRR